MKKKNRLPAMKWLLFGIIFVLDIIFTHYIIRQKLGLFFSSRSNLYLKLDILLTGLNIVFLVLLIDKQYSTKVNKNILKRYKDVNYVFKYGVIILQVLKTIAIHCIDSRFTKIYAIYNIFMAIILTIQNIVNPAKDDKEYKIKRFVYELKHNFLDMNVILFKDNAQNKAIVSTFDTLHMQDTKVSKDNIYIDGDELDEIVEAIEKKQKTKEKDIKNVILDNLVVFLKREDSPKDEEVIKLYDYSIENNLNRKSNYLLLVTDKCWDDYKIPEAVKHISYIRRCRTEKYVEYIENLVQKDAEFTFEKIYNLKRKIRNLLKSVINKKENEEIIKNENKQIIKKQIFLNSKRMYNERFCQLNKTMPTDYLLFNIYKSAFLQNTIHESYFALLNYISALHQLMIYFYYAKNDKSFSENSVNINITASSYSSYKHILKDSNFAKYDEWFAIARDKSYKHLTKEEKLLFENYLSNLIYEDIKIEDIGYFDALNFIETIRNKVNAHGVIPQEEAYEFWCVCYILAECFNNMFRLYMLESYIKDNKVYMKYNLDKEYICLGKYLEVDEYNNIFILQDGRKNKYSAVGYLSGQIYKVTIEENK